MLCMYNYVDKNYDVIIPYTHNTAHVIILPLEINIIIHYTIHLTYNTFNNHLLREGYALFKCFLLLNFACGLASFPGLPPHAQRNTQ